MSNTKGAALPSLVDILEKNPGWLDEAINEAEASRLTGIPKATLQTRRVRGGNSPPYLKLGRSVRYRRRDLLEWLTSQVRRSTSDPGPKAA